MTVFADPHARDPVVEGDARVRVSNLLDDRAWHRASEITAPEHGGSEGLRRLRELRASGWKIEMCRVAGGTERQYRLVSVGTPGARRSLHAPLKSEVAALLDETRAIHKTQPFSPAAVKALQWMKDRFRIASKGTATP